MSSADDPSSRIIELVENYVRPGSHLLTAERIHKNVFEEEIDFTRWEQVVNRYEQRSWTVEEAKEYARQAKQIVEDSSSAIPESYFTIVEPEDLSVSRVKEELNRIEYDPDASGEEKEGFEYKYIGEEDLIDGRYVFVDVESTITYSGELKELTREDAFEFRISPDDNLLIIESTKVTDIQKAKSYFGKKTNFNIDIKGDLTRYQDPEVPVEKIDDFRNSFYSDREDAPDSEPVLLQVDDIQLTDPTISEDEQEEMIEQINFEGKNIADHKEVRGYIEDEWIIKGFEAPVFYDGDLYSLKISGNEVMGYVR
ncbi:hypothetical protein, partial [Natrinema sp. JCM 9743]